MAHSAVYAYLEWSDPMNRRQITLTVALAAFGATAAFAAPAPSQKSPEEIDEIVTAFVQKETEFSQARENYTYRQTVRVYDYGRNLNAKRSIGKWELIQDVDFNPAGRRQERVVYAPPSTLQTFFLGPEDMEDIRNVQPFVMTNDDRPLYDVAFLGEETIDEIECYVFSVKPKQLVKGERYFEGQVWVDQLDLQIVKTYGKGVGQIKEKDRGKKAFPRFETYRDQVDGKYWFPVYTRAEDTLRFDTGDVKMKMVIKYEDYKEYKAQSTITFGDVVEGDGEADQQPQIEETPKP